MRMFQPFLRFWSADYLRSYLLQRQVVSTLLEILVVCKDIWHAPHGVVHVSTLLEILVSLKRTHGHRQLRFNPS